MSEIFLYVMIDKRVFCGMSSKTRILTRFDDALHKLRFSLRKNCLINSRRHMAVFLTQCVRTITTMSKNASEITLQKYDNLNSMKL